jgi:hypothetical protein
MAPDPQRSLDTYFDSAQATRALDESWPPLLGTVLLAVGSDEPPEDETWAAVTDMVNADAVRSIAETVRSTRRDVPLPEDELKIFLGDEDGVQPRLLATFEGCPAALVGPEGVEVRLLETAESLSDHAGIDQVLAVNVDPWGQPTSLVYTGEAEASEVQRVVATAVLASARFRPAYLEGIPIPSRVHLADADVFLEEIREANIAGLDDPLHRGWRDAGSSPITSASRSGRNGGIPCGQGSSQFAVMCGYDFATGRVTSTRTNRWLRQADRMDRMSERGRVSFQIDRRLQRNR